MAGGQGERLRPLTCELPKPMVPVLNRPVLEHLVMLLKRHGFSDIIITAHYMPDVIEDALGDGERFGVDITYVVEEKPLGTAGCVKQLEDMLRDTFLVLSGDALTDFPLHEAVNQHKEKQAISTLVVTEVDDPSLYGIVTHDDDGRLLRFLEKPSSDEVFSHVINTGIYVMEPDVLQYCPDGDPFDFSKDLFPTLLQKGLPVYTHRGYGYWSDIGNCDQYIRSQVDALHRRVRLDGLAETEPPGLWIDPKANVHPTATLMAPIVIGEGAIIEKGAEVGPGVVLGKRCRVGEDAVVKGSVIWEESKIGRHATIDGSVVGRRAIIEAHAQVMEGSAVADEARVRAKSVVEAGSRIWAPKHATPALS